MIQNQQFQGDISLERSEKFSGLMLDDSTTMVRDSLICGPGHCTIKRPHKQRPFDAWTGEQLAPDMVAKKDPKEVTD